MSKLEIAKLHAEITISKAQREVEKEIQAELERLRQAKFPELKKTYKYKKNGQL